MTPLASWLLFLICVAVGFGIYAYVAGGRRYRRMEQQWLDETFTSTEPEDAHIRIFGGPYDAVDRGDFDHDPIRDHAWCEVCNAQLRRAFNRLADLDLGPRDADRLMAAIRRELARV